MIITIDGPAASGKTTVARLLAQELGFYYISSGLLFRGLASILMQEKKYTLDTLHAPHEQDIDDLMHRHTFIYKYSKENNEQLFFNQVNITPFLKQEIISQAASILGLNAYARTAIEKWQHAIAHSHNVIAEGRDTGSVIFPHAQIKFFLTASLAVRAARWAKEQNAKGIPVSLHEAHKEIAKRDERDTSRTFAPLCIPLGAICIDDSELTHTQVVAQMIEIITKKTIQE